MSKIVALVLIAVVSAAQLSRPAFAGDVGSVAGMQAANAQAAAKARMMRAQQAGAARNAMASAMIAATAVEAADAGECSPYLARWMLTKSLASRLQYEACMAD